MPGDAAARYRARSTGRALISLLKYIEKIIFMALVTPYYCSSPHHRFRPSKNQGELTSGKQDYGRMWQ
jgi:hypothetical protein